LFTNVLVFALWYGDLMAAGRQCATSAVNLAVAVLFSHRCRIEKVERGRFKVAGCGRGLSIISLLRLRKVNLRSDGRATADALAKVLTMCQIFISLSIIVFAYLSRCPASCKGCALPAARGKGARNSRKATILLSAD